MEDDSIFIAEVLLTSLSPIFIHSLDSIANLNGALITIANGVLVIARLQLATASGRRAGSRAHNGHPAKGKLH